MLTARLVDNKFREYLDRFDVPSLKFRTEPQSQNHNHRTTITEPQSQNHHHRTTITEPQSQNHHHRTTITEPQSQQTVKKFFEKAQKSKGLEKTVTNQKHSPRNAASVSVPETAYYQGFVTVYTLVCYNKNICTKLAYN